MEIVSFDIAKKLKEKGFDYPCYDAINSFGCTYRNGWCEYLDDRDNELITLADLHKGDCLLPTISQVLKWLREKYVMVFPVYSTNTSRWYCSIVNADSLDTYKLTLSDSYELAVLAGIEYVIDNNLI